MTHVHLVITCSILAFSHPARAQSTSAQAEVLFREGRDLMTAGKFPQACAAFEASQKLGPAPTTLLNLGACREKLGQLATAWGLFLDAERETRSATTTALRKLHRVAHIHAQRLEPRVSKLTISVSDQSRIDGLVIVRDGQRVDSEMWNRALPVDGGSYTISARAPGARRWSTQVTVATELDSKTVDIPELRALARDLAKPGNQSGWERFLASPRLLLGLGGLTLALAGGTIGFSLWGDSIYGDAERATERAAQIELWHSANTRRYIAQGTAVATLGCAGAAAWLYVRSRKRAATELTSRVVIAPAIANEWMGITVSRGF